MTKHTTDFVPAYVIPTLRKSKATKIPKFAGYMSGLFSADYDLAHIIQAYGPDFTHWLVDEIVAGRVDTREITARWLADYMLRQESFNPDKYAGAVTDYAYENVHTTKPAKPSLVDTVYAAAC